MVQSVSTLATNRGYGQEDVTPLSAIRKRASKVSNLWIFDSPKNNRRLTVSGDVPFMHLVLLEGDITVAGYDLVDDPFKVTSDSRAGYVRVRNRDGGEHWLVIGRQGRKRTSASDDAAMPQELQEKARAAGVTVHRRSELELVGKDILLDNWLVLCAIMTRARSYPSYVETERFLAALTRHGSLRVADVLATPDVDPAIMLAVVAKALQDARVHTDLNRHYFGMNSQLTRVRS